MEPHSALEVDQVLVLENFVFTSNGSIESAIASKGVWTSHPNASVCFKQIMETHTCGWEVHP